jgi:hypothetical protein
MVAKASLEQRENFPEWNAHRNRNALCRNADWRVALRADQTER